MRILAIDTATTAGWAVRHSAETWDSGVWDLSPHRHEGGGMRFVRMRSYLRELIATAHPDVVVYEEVRMHMGVDAAHLYGAFTAIIAEECESRDPKLPYQAIHYAHVKKLATGKGNANKDAMLASAQARWPGHVFADHNEADARWLAETAAKELRA